LVDRPVDDVVDRNLLGLHQDDFTSPWNLSNPLGHSIPASMAGRRNDDHGVPLNPKDRSNLLIASKIHRAFRLPEASLQPVYSRRNYVETEM
jgi:hypothetical protein